MLQGLAGQLIRFAGEGYAKPATFLGIGGTRIFRDDIYSRLRFPFRADHEYYHKHGMYDFPQGEIKTRLINAVMLLLVKIPPMRKEIYTRHIKGEIIRSLQKVV